MHALNHLVMECWVWGDFCMFLGVWLGWAWADDLNRWYEAIRRRLTR